MFTHFRGSGGNEGEAVPAQLRVLLLLIVICALCDRLVAFDSAHSDPITGETTCPSSRTFLDKAVRQLPEGRRRVE